MTEEKPQKKSVLVHVIRHPRQIMGIFNRANIKMFFSMAHYSGFRAALKTSMNVMNNSLEDIRRLENLDEYTAVHEEVPEHVELPYFDEPLVSIVIPVYNQYKFTMACIRSVEENTRDVPYEIILGDDRSTDETVDIAKHVSNMVIVRNETNLGFTLNCNHAAEKARGKYILFLNNDTIVREKWLSSMVELITSADDIGIVGSKLVYPDGLVQEAGGIIWSDGTARNYGKGGNPNESPLNYVKEVDYVTGASLLVRRDLFEQLGGFDPIYAPAYCEDSDLCMSVRKLGYRVMYQPRSNVIHFEGMTHGKNPKKGLNPHQITNIAKFKEKWAAELNNEHCRPGTDSFHARERSMGKKSILFITSHTPSGDLDSGLRGYYSNIVLLKKCGYNVKVASPDLIYDKTYIEPLQQHGIEVFYGGDVREIWKDELKKHKKVFEYVVICGYRCADRMMNLFEKHSKSKIVYLVQNNPQLGYEREYDITHDARTLLELATIKRRNPTYMKKADLCITTSTTDSEYVSANCSTCVTQINKYSVKVGEHICNTSHSKDIAFIGFLGSRPNLDGVIWFVNEVMPILRAEMPGIRLHLIGSAPENDINDILSEDVVSEGHLPDEDVIRIASKCSLCINPLHIGAGTRINVMDCMSQGMPIVSTKYGLETLEGIDYPSFSTAREMADAVMRIISDEEYSRELSRKGMDYLRSGYTEEKLIEGFRKIFN